MQSNQSDISKEGISRKGCLGLLVGGLLFIVSTTYLLFYMGSTSFGEAIEASFRAAIVECREKAQQTGFKLDQDDCEKSAKKFIRKFGYEP